MESLNAVLNDPVASVRENAAWALKELKKIRADDSVILPNISSAEEHVTNAEKELITGCIQSSKEKEKDATGINFGCV